MERITKEEVIMKRVPGDVKASAKRIADKVDQNDYNIFYRNKKRKGPTNNFLAWFTGNHFYELQRKNIDVKDARKVRAYLHQNQKTSVDYGPEILISTNTIKRVAVLALLAALGLYGYYKFVYEKEEREEDLFFLIDERQGFDDSGGNQNQNKALYTALVA